VIYRYNNEYLKFLEYDEKMVYFLKFNEKKKKKKKDIHFYIFLYKIIKIKNFWNKKKKKYIF